MRKQMAKTSVTMDHEHAYLENGQRTITSLDHNHSHIVPPLPAKVTEVSNGHNHQLIERMMPSMQTPNSVA
jgi:hypothetical protein